MRFPGSSLFAVELGLQASRHSLDLDRDRALALNLRPVFWSGEFPPPIDPAKCSCTNPSDLGVIHGSLSKSKSKITIKIMASHSTENNKEPYS
jgi:hypothetical protein